MIDREWVSLHDPDEPHDRYVFDVSFLLSSYECIYGAGCPGIDASKGGAFGCCLHGAYYMDDEDRRRTEAMVDVLGPEYMQFHAEAQRGGVSARAADGGVRTRKKDGGCIFLNRDGWGRGPGCALHQYAVERGEHHMTYKPEICWLVPLRRFVEETVADDGEPMVTTTITSFDRGAWGAGGADFDWWCMDAEEPWGATQPVYRSMEHELRAMTSDAVYKELAAYLDDRRANARKPLPFPIFVR